MNRTKRIAILLTLLALSLLAFGVAHAQCYNVQRNGVAAFNAPTLQINGSTWNFTGDCGQDPPPPPAGLTHAQVTWIGHGRDESLSNVDLTTWPNLYGRVDVTDGQGHPLPLYPWPGASSASPQWFLPNNQMVCSAFQVPSDTPLMPGIDPATHQPYTFGPAHSYTTAGYSTGLGITISLGPTCGAIAPAPCSKTFVSIDAQSLWYRAGTGTGFYCGLPVGTWQVATIKWTSGRPVDPTPAHPFCSAAGCRIALQHN